MADLRLKGEYQGPGEQKTAEYLQKHLPAEWVVFFGRKLPGKNRDDTDFIVVGARGLYVLEEKSWGPTIVVHDNFWQVKGDTRPNPLNRNAQLAKKLATLLRNHVNGYKSIVGKRVTPAVVLSHDEVNIITGANHQSDEEIIPLKEVPRRLVSLEAGFNTALGAPRAALLRYLDDLPPRPKSFELSGYTIRGTLDVPGLETAYVAETTDGQQVVLKCYPKSEFDVLGDPKAFLMQEIKAINKLADANRTWRAHPFIESHAFDLYVVPVVPPKEGQTMAAALAKPGAERANGILDPDVARSVALDAFQALADVHAEGLVHRALHPRRVWLGKQMRVLLSDFHLARVPGATTIAAWQPDGDISEDYRAPECAADIGFAGERSDVYSLVLCVGEWLLGEPATQLSIETFRARLEKTFPWFAPALAGLDTNIDARPAASEIVERLKPPAAPLAPLDPEDEFQPGGIVGGRYEVKRSLGSGGFATSWEVYDKVTDQTKVLKQFKGVVPDEIRAEYKNLAKINHEKCGRVYDIDPSHKPVYLVLGFVEGDSLKQLGIKRELEEFRRIALDVLEALQYLHDKELIHGDVTPGNIVVKGDGSGEATLIDFGLAGREGQHVAGMTPSFCAPEVLHGGIATKSADLYCLGTTLARAMLGRPVTSVGKGMIVSVEPPTESELFDWGSDGAALLKVLMRAVTTDVSHRPSSATDFRKLVASAQTGARSSHRDVQTDQPLPNLINPTIKALRRLYRASGEGNAGNRGLDDVFARETYVQTFLDTELIPRVAAGELDVVLLSGNPGDGKTSVLVQLGDALRQAGATVVGEDDAGWSLELGGRAYNAVYDASESHGDISSDDLVRRALDPAKTGNATALIAVNDGRLLKFFTDYEDEYEQWSLQVFKQLDGQGDPDSRLALVDLKRRSLAALDGDQGLARRQLASMTRDELWNTCAGCAANQECPMLANRQLLMTGGTAAVEELVLTSHLRRRRRATFRDLRSALSWLLTADTSCKDVHGWRAEGLSPVRMGNVLAFDVAFDPTSDDYLIKEWAEIDPATVAAPRADVLWRKLKREQRGAAYSSTASVARALYFRDEHLAGGGATPRDVRAYRHFDEFLNMLRAADPENTKRRLLLGVSRLVGAFGYAEEGLAISSGMPGSTWAVLHTIPADEFEVTPLPADRGYVEAIPDELTMRHVTTGSSLMLTLDTAEIILRAANGEIVDDAASDAVRQEIDGFASQLSRQPSHAARIVNAAGSVHLARVHGADIVLEDV